MRTREMPFERDVHCLMGLPFDAVGMADAVREVRDAAFNNRRCFISTPNLNFVVGARGDDAFRQSVLRSDLSLADGMPLVWVARLLGVPIRERVSGAGLFEHLQVHAGEPVSVYFFGGPDGAAEAACHRVNRDGGGLRCAGFDAPGFGSVQAMSTPAHIDKANGSKAMFVIAALGAKKGQQWLELNADRLSAPVLCHLGAVVNFAAGTVQRAPRWVQSIGAEWLWRIAQEPALWKRYVADGLAFLRVMANEVVPLIVQRRLEAWREDTRAPTLTISTNPDGTALSLAGNWSPGDLPSLRGALQVAQRSGTALVLDLEQTSRIGSAALGLLLVAKGAWAGSQRFQVGKVSRTVLATINRSGASHLLAPDR